MPAIDTVTDGGARLRVRAFRGRADVAELSSAPVGAAVSPRLVDLGLDRAHALGYRHAVTPALAPAEWRPFLDAGFVVREELHLLTHDLLDLPEPPSVTAPARHRRVFRTDRARVLAIDHAAFPAFWRLDADGLTDAVQATPSVRFRIDRRHRAYALTGRSGDRGYVQRLAVEPHVQGRGLGAALVVDGLRWLKRWRAVEALVNTQVENERALALYERLGFRRRRHGLAVLERPLGAGPSALGAADPSVLDPRP